MRKIALFVFLSGVASAQTWAGKLVDAVCKASNEASGTCSVTAGTHLFAVELQDGSILNLNAVGNEKAASAVARVQKQDLRATVTGSLQGRIVKVETIEIQ